METNTNYPYVTFEIAERLKEIGFDKPCSAVYERNKFYNPPQIEFICSGNNNHGWDLEGFKRCVVWMEEHHRPKFFDKETKNSLLNEFLFAVPTYSEVIDWFYEKHKLFIGIWIDPKGLFEFAISEYKPKPVESWVRILKNTGYEEKDAVLIDAVSKAITVTLIDKNLLNKK